MIIFQFYNFLTFSLRDGVKNACLLDQPACPSAALRHWRCSWNSISRLALRKGLTLSTKLQMKPFDCTFMMPVKAGTCCCYVIGLDSFITVLKITKYVEPSFGGFQVSFWKAVIIPIGKNFGGDYQTVRWFRNPDTSRLNMHNSRKWCQRFFDVFNERFNLLC